MKKICFLLLLFFVGLVMGQELKQVKVGQAFNISYPSSYSKTYDLNDSACLQLSNLVQEKYFFIIQEEKEILKFLHVEFTNINEALEFYAKGLISNLPDNKNKKVSKIKNFKINGYNAAEISIEGDFVDEETDKTYTLVYNYTLIESQNYYYQILAWSNINKRDAYGDEFKKMINSFKEEN